DRDAALAGEVAADVAHRARLAGHPDPGAVGYVSLAGRRRQLGTERGGVAPVVPGDAGLRWTAEVDLVVGTVDLDVRLDGHGLRQGVEQGADGRDRGLVGGQPPVIGRRLEGEAAAGTG